MTGKPEIFLFDVDGTLIDNESKRNKYWYDALSALGFDPTLTDYTDVCGSGDDELTDYLTKKYGVIIDQQELIHTLETMEAQEPEIQRDGAEDLLSYIKQKNIRIAAVTSNTRKNALKYLADTNLINFFEFIVTKDDVNNIKPDPEIYILATKRSGLPADKCIAVEDSAFGAISAYSAQVPYIYIPGLFCSDRPDIEEKALVTFKSLRNVIKWLDDIL